MTRRRHLLGRKSPSALFLSTPPRGTTTHLVRRPVAVLEPAQEPELLPLVRLRAAWRRTICTRDTLFQARQSAKTHPRRHGRKRPWRAQKALTTKRDRTMNIMIGRTITRLEEEDGVDQMLERLGPRDLGVLGDVRREEEGHAEALGAGEERHGALADLRAGDRKQQCCKITPGGRRAAAALRGAGGGGFPRSGGGSPGSRDAPGWASRRWSRRYRGRLLRSSPRSPCAGPPARALGRGEARRPKGPLSERNEERPRLPTGWRKRQAKQLEGRKETGARKPRASAISARTFSTHGSVRTSTSAPPIPRRCARSATCGGGGLSGALVGCLEGAGGRGDRAGGEGGGGKHGGAEGSAPRARAPPRTRRGLARRRRRTPRAPAEAARRAAGGMRRREAAGGRMRERAGGNPSAPGLRPSGAAWWTSRPPGRRSPARLGGWARGRPGVTLRPRIARGRSARGEKLRAARAERVAVEW